MGRQGSARSLLACCATIGSAEREGRRQGGQQPHIPGFADKQGAALHDAADVARITALPSPGRGHGADVGQEPLDVAPVEGPGSWPPPAEPASTWESTPRAWMWC